MLVYKLNPDLKQAINKNAPFLLIAFDFIIFYN